MGACPADMPTPLAAVILAAGQGTRMKSDRPKVLHEVAGIPLVGHPIRLALGLGADSTVVVVGHKADDVKAALDARFPAQLRYEIQSQQLGTGHAVQEGMKSLPTFEGRVLILYGDVPLLREETVKQLITTMDEGRHALVAVTMVLDDPTGYGRIVRDAAGKVQGVVEHKDATPAQREIKEGNAGIYLVDSTFLRSALAKLDNKNAQGEYYLTDIVAAAAKDSRGASTVIVSDPVEVMGANDRTQLAELAEALRKRTNRRHMIEGVTIVDPATTAIGPDVTIGRDTIIEAGVHLRGKTKIGSGVTIDAYTIITDCTVADRAQIKSHSVLDEASVGPGAIIGPFARLRPGAEVMDDAHVGNFVELKKTKLGKGSKANHLAYLGDSIIGEGANVGAGTITCNYDGYGKYLTVIGDGVFVGSNSTLVAPIEIGKNAYVAAGSVLTEKVGAEGLAFGRARQVEKPGRATPLREEAKAKAAELKKRK